MICHRQLTNGSEKETDTDIEELLECVPSKQGHSERKAEEGKRGDAFKPSMFLKLFLLRIGVKSVNVYKISEEMHQRTMMCNNCL